MASIYDIVEPDPRNYERSDYLVDSISAPAVHSASKTAVVGLTRWLEANWGAQNRLAHCLVPVGVSSDLNAVFQQNYATCNRTGRMAEAAEIVEPEMFLAFDAANHVSGQVLAADGG